MRLGLWVALAAAGAACGGGGDGGTTPGGDPPVRPHAVFEWSPPATSAGGAVVTVGLRLVSGTAPAWLDLVAGDLAVGRVTAATGWSLAWDTAAVAEGTYLLAALPPPGHDLSAPGGPSVTVRRSPPVLRDCASLGAWSTVDPRSGRTACFLLAFDEPVTLTGLTLGYGDDRRAIPVVEVRDGGLGHLACPDFGPAAAAPLWPSQRLLATATDAAGRSAPVTCDRVTPLWRVEWDYVPAGPFSELSVDLPTDCSDFPDLPREPSWLLADYAPGHPMAGALDYLRYVRINPQPATWDRLRTLTATGATASALRGRAWLERAPGGAAQVFELAPDTSRVGPRNRDPARDAFEPATALAMGQGMRTAWAEETGGGAALHVTGVAADPPAPPAGASAREPALGLVTTAGAGWSWLAWVERAAGLPARLRAAALPDGAAAWQELPTAGNATAAADASAPTVWAWGDARAIAWEEGGTVWVRRAGAGWAFGPAVQVAADPARPARHPVFDPLTRAATLYWLERTAAGEDLILARRWDGQSWALVPGPAVNASLPGEVLDLSVSGGVIGWLDARGHAELRRTDCF